MIGYPKQKAFRSKKYLEFIRKQPCIICLKNETEAHHCREFNSGIGIKPSDTFSIPLCREHHYEIHNIGKNSFYGRHEIDIYRELHRLTSRFIEDIL